MGRGLGRRPPRRGRASRSDALGSERRLSAGKQPLRLGRFDRGAAVVVALLCLLAVLISAVASLDLSSALSAWGWSRPGRPGGSVGSDLAPYVGLDNQLDTGARGTLSNAVVLRVKADVPDFWRGAPRSIGTTAVCGVSRRPSRRVDPPRISRAAGV